MKILKKLLVVALALCISGVMFACGNSEKKPPEVVPPIEKTENIVSDWASFDVDNIKNIKQTQNDGVDFEFFAVTKNSYKNVYASVTKHKKANNVVEVSVTNKAKAKAHFLVCLEDATGGDKAVYNGLVIEPNETKIIKTFMYVDETKFTGELTAIKLFPNSSGDGLAGCVNGNVSINSVEFKTETPPLPEKGAELSAPTVAAGSESNIVVKDNKVTFTYTASPVDTYKSISFAPSKYDRAKLNSARFSVIYTAVGDDATKTMITLGFKSVWSEKDAEQRNIEAYGENFAVKNVATIQIFEQHYIWSDKDALVTNLNAIELFVNSNASGIAQTLTGTFTITAEFFNFVPEIIEPDTKVVIGAVTENSEKITIVNDVVSFDYGAEDPKDKYQAIAFDISNWSSYYNKYKITIINKGSTAFKIGFKASVTLATDVASAGYGSSMSVIVGETAQIFSDYSWGSAGGDIKALSKIELFVNSNADANVKTKTGSFTIILELIHA